MSTYIITCRNNRYWLVGPFADSVAAGKWNCLRANNPSDDPRWQVLDLEDAASPVVVLSPETASGRADANAY